MTKGKKSGLRILKRTVPFPKRKMAIFSVISLNFVRIAKKIVEKIFLSHDQIDLRDKLKF